MNSYISLLIFVVILIYTHELGHYFCAKKEKIYSGWGLTPNPHIKLSSPHKKRIYYLGGFLMSLISYIPFAILYENSIKGLGMFFLLALSISIIDIGIFFYPGKFEVEEKK